MSEERTWRNEAIWWLSCGLTLLAVLLPVAAAEGIYRAIGEPGANVDRFNVAVGWTVVLPFQIVVAFWPFFASGALSTRLLVPTFAGASPRVVASVVCTAPALLGVYATTLDGLTTVVYGGAALAWALIMPLPLKDLFAAGANRGGLIIGMALATTLNVVDGLLIAIVWCSWRLYRNHPTETAITAVIVALLPMLVVADDPRATFATPFSLYTSLETALLLCLAMAGVVLGQFRQTEPAEEVDGGAA